MILAQLSGTGHLPFEFYGKRDGFDGMVGKAGWQRSDRSWAV